MSTHADRLEHTDAVEHERAHPDHERMPEGTAAQAAHRPTGEPASAQADDADEVPTDAELDEMERTAAVRTHRFRAWLARRHVSIRIGYRVLIAVLGGLVVVIGLDRSSVTPEPEETPAE